MMVWDSLNEMFKPYELLVDTLSSTFWMVSSICRSEACKKHKSYHPIERKLKGQGYVMLNSGWIKGRFYKTSLDLKMFILKEQTLLLLDEMSIPNVDVIFNNYAVASKI